MNFMRSKEHHLFLLLHVSLLCCSRSILTRHHNSNFVGVILFILFYFHTIWNKKRLVLLHEFSVGCSSHMLMQLSIFCYRFGFLTNCIGRVRSFKIVRELIKISTQIGHQWVQLQIFITYRVHIVLLCSNRRPWFFPYRFSC